jgi:hypothetical protein
VSSTVEPEVGDPAEPQDPPPEPTARTTPEVKPDAGEQEAAIARRRRALAASAMDMARSLAVIVAIVGVVVLLVPRPNARPVAAVDVAGPAAGSTSRLGFAPAVPQGLPDGWKAINVAVRNSTGDALTWHVGFLSPEGRSASIEQAVHPSKQWEIVLDSGGTDRAPQTIDGRTWSQEYKVGRDVTALIYRGEGHTTMVTSKGGGLQDATLLARSIPASNL